MTKTQTIAGIAREYGKSVKEVQRRAGAKHLSPDAPLSEFDAAFLRSLIEHP